MTKTEALAVYTSFNKAWDAFCSEWASVAQDITDERAELEEKFDNLSEKAQEGPRGVKITEALDETSDFADDLDAESHGDFELVNNVMTYLRTKAGLED